MTEGPHGTPPSPLLRHRRPRGPHHARGRKARDAAAAAQPADQGAGDRDRRRPLRAPSARRRPDRRRPLASWPMPRPCWPRSTAPPPARAARRAARSAASPWASPPRRRSIRWSRAPSASSAPSRPDVSFVLEETGSVELLAGLREERLDIAFIRSGLADPAGLAVHALLQEDMVAALPARHRLARRPHLTLKDLADGDLHPLPPARRARALRRHHHGLQRGGLQPACRPGGAAHRLDA